MAGDRAIKRSPLIEAKLRDDLLWSAVEDPALAEAHARAMLSVSVKFLTEILGPCEAMEATYQAADGIELPAASRRFCANIRGKK